MTCFSFSQFPCAFFYKRKGRNMCAIVVWQMLSVSVGTQRRLSCLNLLRDSTTKSRSMCRCESHRLGRSGCTTLRVEKNYQPRSPSNLMFTSQPRKTTKEEEKRRAGSSSFYHGCTVETGGRDDRTALTDRRWRAIAEFSLRAAGGLALHMPSRFCAVEVVAHASRVAASARPPIAGPCPTP